MEERRGYICGECKNWVNPQDIGDGTAWAITCKKGVVVSGLSVPCVPSEIFFTSYHNHPTVKPKRIKRAKLGRLFSFNQNGFGFIDILFYILLSVATVFLLYYTFEAGRRGGQLDNSVVISNEDLKEIMFQLSENQKQLMALQVTSAENFQKIEMLERALLATSLFDILRGDREWTSENVSPKEEEK